MKYLVVTSAAAPEVASAWNNCLDAAEYATHYTAPEFFREKTFEGKRPFAVLALEETTIHGVVTGFFDGRDVICGSPGSSHVCVRRGANLGEVGRALTEGLQQHARGAASYVRVHTWTEMPSFQTAGYRLQRFEVPMCTILLDLSKGKDSLFRQCSETRRNKIRRAIKAGVVIEEMGIEKDFDAYYELYRHWCDSKNVKRTAYERQRAIFESTENRLILVARHEGRIVGVSTFRFRRPGMVEYAGNVPRREETRIRQNDLLLWRGIEWSVEQGSFGNFSMAGAHFFLQKFGGRAHSTYGYSLDRTLFRRRHVAATLRAVALKAFHRLPESARRRTRKLLRQPSEAD